MIVVEEDVVVPAVIGEIVALEGALVVGDVVAEGASGVELIIPSCILKCPVMEYSIIPGT